MVNPPKKRRVVINLDQLVPKARPRPLARETSTTSLHSAEDPVMGITTASNMQLPFDLVDMNNDPIFQNNNTEPPSQQEQSAAPPSDSSSTDTANDDRDKKSGSGQISLDIALTSSASGEDNATTPLLPPSPGHDAASAEDDTTRPSPCLPIHAAVQEAEDMDISESETESEESAPLPRGALHVRSTTAATSPQTQPASGRPDGDASDDDMDISSDEDESPASVNTRPLTHGPALPVYERHAANQPALASSRDDTAGLRQGASVVASPGKPVPATQAPQTSTTNESAATSDVATNNGAVEVREKDQARPTNGGASSSDQDMQQPADDGTRRDSNGESSRQTPPLLGSSSREDEEPMLREIMEKIDRDILRQEEKALFELVDRSITAQEKASERGGTVLYVARVNDDGHLEEEEREVVRDPLKRDALPPSRKLAEGLCKESDAVSSRVFDLEDTAMEVANDIRLPKYADGKHLLLTPLQLQKAVVDKIVARERRYIPRRQINARLDDDPNDPQSVVLHCQGHPTLVEEVEAQVTLLISAKQRRVEEQKPVDIDDVTRPDSTRSKKQAQRTAQYNEFLESYHDVKQIEYNGSSLHKQHVNGSMWAKHKSRYGVSCDDDCRCPRDISFLTSTVVSSHMTKELRKDPFWTNPEGLREDASPVGFVNWFAPKFFPMLEREFPREKPKQILSRLVLMWGEHRKTQRFGIRCDKKCPCGEGWEFVFKRGRLKGEDVQRSDRASSSVPTSAPIARRPSKKNARVDRASSAAIPSKRKTRASSPPPSFQPRPYEVVFDAGEQLCCFFVTEKTRDGLVCKIDSINNYVKPKDSRLQAGTIVTEATADGDSGMIPVRTHSDLKRIFDDAAKCRSSLRVCFINKSAPSSLIANMPGVTQTKCGEWTPVGKWRGSTKHGWPGGARCVGAKDTRKGVQRANLQNPQQPSTRDEGSGTNEPIGSSSTDHTREAIASRSPPNVPQHQDTPPDDQGTLDLCYSTSMAPAKHRAQKPSISIFREPKRAKKSSATSTGLQAGSSIQRYMPQASTGRKVKFNDKSFETRFFDKEKESFKLAMVQRKSAVSTQTSTTRRVSSTTRVVGSSELIDAVRNKGIDDVVALLQAGACPNEKDQNNKTAKDWVSNYLASVAAERKAKPDNSRLAALEVDYTLKRKVLLIYTEALSIIDKARFNKKWEHFRFRIQNIKNVRLSVKGDDHSGSNVLDCRISKNGIVMKQMPLVPLDTSTEQWTNDRSELDYSFGYNAPLAADSPREIVVSLYKGDRTKDTNEPPMLLGEVAIPYSRIISAVETGKGIIEEHIKPNDFLLSGSISIEARKVRDKTIHENKARETALVLKELINWITQFKGEKQGDGSAAPHLSAHIVAPQSRISLLHAAIYLHEPDLVRKLLELSADPLAPSDVGSAKVLAMNMMGDRRDDAKSLAILSQVGVDVSDVGMGEDAAGEQRVPVSPALDQEASLGNSVTARDAASEKGKKTSSEQPMMSPKVDRRPEVEQRGGSPPVNGTGHSRESLPLLDFWFHPKEQGCQFFHRPKGCRYGVGCYKLHINPPIGRALDGPIDQLHDVDLCQEYVAVRRVSNDRGRAFFAAAYRDTEKNVVFEAERGETCGRNRQAVYWYRTEKDAVDALKRVVAYSFSRSDKVVGQKLRPGVSPSRSDSHASRGPPDNKRTDVYSRDDTSHELSHDPTLLQDTGSRNEIAGTEASHPAPPRKTSLPDRVLKMSSKQLAATPDPGHSTGVQPLEPRQGTPTPRRESTSKTSPVNGTGDVKMSLPSLDYWFAPREKRCPHFNRTVGCRHGRGCHMLHVHPPIGNALDDGVSVKMHHADFRQEHVTVRRLANDRGQWFFTAAYRDEEDNTVYEAERGKTAGQSRQGVYWYRTENDAIDALARVIALSHAQKNGSYKVKHRQSTQAGTGIVTDTAQGPHVAAVQQDTSRKDQTASHKAREYPAAGVNDADRTAPSDDTTALIAPSQQQVAQATIRDTPGELHANSAVNQASRQGRCSPTAKREIAAISHTQGRTSPPTVNRTANADLSLPTLDYWFRPNEQICQFYNRSQGCRFGEQCFKLHINRPIGQVLDNNRVQLQLPDVDIRHDNVAVRRITNGVQWLYAAAYKDTSAAEHIVYEAQGGRTVGKNDQDVYWYATENDAMDALKKVIAFSSAQKLDKPGKTKRSQEAISSYDAHDERARVERPDKRARHENDVASMQGGTRISTKALFDRLRHSNLSVIYKQITGDYLRKTDWKIYYRDNYFTAAFFDDRETRYCSQKLPRGRWFDGCWFHRDEKAAKASAFLDFAESCIRRGDVNGDFTYTRDGKRITGGT